MSSRSASRAVALRRTYSLCTPANAGPRHNVRALRSASAPSPARPDLATERPALTRRWNCAVSNSAGSISRTYPGARVRSTPAPSLDPRILRNLETQIWIWLRAVAGGASPQSASTSSSTDVTRAWFIANTQSAVRSRGRSICSVRPPARSSGGPSSKSAMAATSRDQDWPAVHAHNGQHPSVRYDTARGRCNACDPADRGSRGTAGDMMSVSRSATGVGSHVRIPSGLL